MQGIFIGSLGGTIAMTRQDDRPGALPKLSAAQLLDSIPGFVAQGPIQAETVLQVASASLGFDDMMQVLAWCEARQADGATAIILTQGTDSIEETSWLLDLFWRHDTPLIMTGAMRLPASAGADGPANLEAALRVAADPASRARGVLVVMNDTIHAARHVRKSDSMSVQTFDSGPAGPLGRLVEGVACYFAPPQRITALPPPQRMDHDVGLVALGIGSGTGQLRHAITAPDYAAVVIAAFGAGHLPAALAPIVSEAAGDRPVIFASRCGSGPTAQNTYGYPGSEIDLIARGAWPGGWLSPLKARIAIWAVLATGAQSDAARALFVARTGV